MTGTSYRPGIPVLALLLAGLFPAGDAWCRVVAWPMLAIELSYAIPFVIPVKEATAPGHASDAGSEGTAAERAIKAMSLILGKEE